MHPLVSNNWDFELAKISYEDMRAKCLFAVIWSEKEEGGYNQSDFHPFVALEKVINQGVEAYEGISLGTSMDKIKKGKLPERRINVHGRTYYPAAALGHENKRLTVVKDPDELIEPFLNRWKQQP
jgi:hypothetical protein